MTRFKFYRWIKTRFGNRSFVKGDSTFLLVRGANDKLINQIKSMGYKEEFRGK